MTKLDCHANARNDETIPLFTKKKAAFTLAEVLITLGIIGVVAAMTMPTLIAKHNQKHTVVQLKKAYSLISQATKLLEVEEGDIAGWGWGNYPDPVGAEKIMKMYARHFKVLKDCGTRAGEGCFAKGKAYKHLRGDDKDILDNRNYWGKLLLANGVSLGIVMVDANCSKTEGTSILENSVCGQFYVDVNGPKEPNQWGKDFFEFFITKHGIVPTGTSDTVGENAPESCISTGTGFGCAAWVLEKENLDYLKQ